ncbi:serine/threonine phosphatase [Tepidanaerobacter syntrophicus]|uniref:SpoIIE family protein phosphatase n=1 Tax=Tepidanaerobacter syntrophicus TaxID=224999 RepID=UPI0022ED8ABE|nr:SpoIIE family protein phosphatase [Tepidanaerobacter syntrophicus]GLI49953.1 serine/threonine phosphatase [Tepidanaerobacter syntrophicus]
MKVRTEIYWESLNKYGEELCGDKVETVQNPNETIMVMADGLGSGVKANILSTLTSKIAVTMLKQGLSIEETIKTIMATLPICKVRKIAYSTFTIIRVDSAGNCYIAEYGNPPVMLLRGGKVLKLYGDEREIEGKQVTEYRFKTQIGDVLITLSDGVVHAGVGGILNLGWQWKNIAEYIEKIAQVEHTLGSLVKLLSAVTTNLYMEKPGDDATIAALKIIKPEFATVFTGPPQDPKDDEKVIERLMKSEGKKIVCGGTAAQITARILGREIITSTEFVDANIPPTAKIEGIDLVTEGVLTLAHTRELLLRYMDPAVQYKQLRELERKDGASRLAKLLLSATDITFLIGKAINPAHQNPDFPKELSIKLNIVKEIGETLEKIGKNIEMIYY